MAKDKIRIVTKDDYIASLNNIYSVDEILMLTEHIWAGEDKTQKVRNHARALAINGCYGQILYRYDKVAFKVGFEEYKLL